MLETTARLTTCRVFRGDGPRSIDAYKFIETVNNANSDCLVILECLIPDRLENKWSFDGRMTEIMVSGNNDSDSNFFETIDGFCGNYASAPPAKAKARRSLPELFAKDYSISTNTRRVWLKKTKEGCKDLIQRFAIDPKQVRRDRHLELVAVEIQGPGDPNPVTFPGSGASEDHAGHGGGDEDEDEEIDEDEDFAQSDTSEDDADAIADDVNTNVGDGGDEDEEIDVDDEPAQSDSGEDDADANADGDNIDVDIEDHVDGRDVSNATATLEPQPEVTRAKSPAAKSGLGKRKRGSHQEARNQAPRLSQNSSPENAGTDATTFGQRLAMLIDLEGGKEGEEYVYLFPVPF